MIRRTPSKCEMVVNSKDADGSDHRSGTTSLSVRLEAPLRISERSDVICLQSGEAT